jgi:DegV family protein with EDD domain
MPVRIVTDSSCDLDAATAEELGIEIVPLSIRFGSEEHTDGVDLSTEEFYNKMAASAELPQTAAPSPGAFEQAYRRQQEAGADAVVCVTISSELSATMQAAQQGAKAVEDDLQVRVVDSRSITTGLGTLARRAAQAGHDGQDADAILEMLDDLITRTRVIGSLDTLENLKKGGRIGNAQALVGSLLSIKPLVDISTGKVEEAGKARTRRKAMEWLRDQVLEQPDIEDLCVAHGMAPDVDTFVSMLAPRYKPEDVSISLIGPVIGTHGGPRFVGATWIAAR